MIRSLYLLCREWCRGVEEWDVQDFVVVDVARFAHFN